MSRAASSMEARVFEEAGTFSCLGANGASATRISFSDEDLTAPAAGDATQSAAKAEMLGRIAASVKYMMGHLNEPVQVTKLSSLAGMSPSHFFFMFKQVTGTTPLNFFIRARMRRACELLAETDFNIKEVAGRLGYDDPFYFSRLFKSVEGVSPRDYRSSRKTVARTIGAAGETSSCEPGGPVAGLARMRPLLSLQPSDANGKRRRMANGKAS